LTPLPAGASTFSVIAICPDTLFGLTGVVRSPCVIDLIWTVGSTGATTVIAAVLRTVGSATAAAVITAVPGATPVTRPDSSTVATFSADELNVTADPSDTVATSCSVSPGLISADSGVSVSTSGGGAFTRIDAAAFFVGSATDVAVITAIPGATAVTRPDALTVAIASAGDDHVTAWLLAFFTTATSCTVSPTMRSETSDGTIVTSTGAPGSGAFTSIVAVAFFVGSAADVAVITAVPGATPVTRPLVLTVAMFDAADAHVTF